MSPREKSSLPEVINNDVYFGMSKNEFVSLMGAKVKEADNSGYNFRHLYIENIGNDKLNNIVYYFDADGDQPLYEVILNYSDTNTRNFQAQNLFGKPNYESKEWRLTRPESYNIWAWTFKSKLVIVGIIHDVETEWTEYDWK